MTSAEPPLAELRITLPQCVVRAWRHTDKASLVKHADNRKIWRNLTHAFPHPYTAADADRWLDRVTTQVPCSHFAIEVDGEAAGGIGVEPLGGIFATTGEIGYWLGEPFWGRGIVTAAASALVPRAMSALKLHRLEAAVFEWNPASMRVLEKLGFVCEGVLCRSAVKDGQVIDRVMYGLTDLG